MSSDSTHPTPSRGRGRGNSRGGLGKYLRARGRRGAGRPAEFRERLVLEGEKPEGLDEEEAAKRAAKFARRQLGTNADRYVEPEPELGSDGEPIVEPEVDLSNFRERQALTDENESSLVSELQGQLDDENDVDHSLAHITSAVKPNHPQAMSRKGKIKVVEWDEELELMARENAAAEATRDLKERFRAKSDKLRRPIGAKERKGNTVLIEAPALPSQDPPKDPKTEIQDFLDDLLG